MTRQSSGQRIGVVVVGMHRSGTSVTARIFGELGCDFCGELVPGRDDNPEGYFEHAAVVRIHNELLAALGRTWDDPRPLCATDFASAAAQAAREEIRRVFDRDFAARDLWVLKDPRLCTLLPLWQDVLERSATDIRFVHVTRHPRAVAASLARRDGLGRAWSLLLWLRHSLAAERSTRGATRAWLRFEELVAEPTRSMRRVLEQLQLGERLGPAACDGVAARRVSPTAVHHRPSEAEASHPWIDAVQQALTVLCRDRDALHAPALAELDRVAAEVELADAILGGERDAAAVRHRELCAHCDNLSAYLAESHRYVESLKQGLQISGARLAEATAYSSSLRQALDVKIEELRQLQRQLGLLEEGPGDPE